MSHSSSARWLAVFPAAVALATVATFGTAAVARPVSTPAHDGSGPVERPAALSLTLSYHSALEGYRPFADEKAIPWREANETVYRRGGWQAYAKENAGPGMAGAPSMKDKP